MNKAVFLDRDGVINKLVFNPKTSEFEPPPRAENLDILPKATGAIKRLNAHGYKTFIVSNQPDYAKGKNSLENIKAVGKRFEKLMEDNGVNISEYYYCYHHPAGVVPEYSMDCECRKPKDFFVQKAKKDYNLDLLESWFIGDRDTDILCGQRAGTRTILILNDQEKKKGQSKPNYIVNDLSEATDLILGNENH